MFSIYDERFRSYFNSGRNSETQEEAIDAALNLVMGSHDWWISDKEAILGTSKKARIRMLRWSGLILHEHSGRVDEKSDPELAIAHYP